MSTTLLAKRERGDVPDAPADLPHPPRRGDEYPQPRLRDRAAVWIRTRRLSLAVLSAVLAVVAAVNAWNLHGWPARVNDDEGTYVAQAWAMVARGDIAHYTYWYDHPFLGWAMIAAYARLTDGFDRAPSGVMVGREFMLITIVVSCALLFLLARRLRFGRTAAAGTVLLFGLSPLAIYFHRMVFLDNLAIMWTIGALAAAASRRRSIAAAFSSAVCMGAAVLTKETSAILLPALVWMLLQHTDRRTRAWNLGVFFSTFAVIVASYPVFALLKNELIPGDGHVSLVWAVWWQLFGRSGSGSLFDTNGSTFALAKSWVDIDAWLLLGGAALVPLGFVSRRLRPVALALLIQIVMMMRGGYMPFAYVIALLPFAALLIGGILDSLGRGDLAGPLPARYRAGIRRAGWVPLIAAVTAFAVLGAPGWVRTIQQQSTMDGSANSRDATRWVIDHVDRDAVVVTDDYIWLDLTIAHFTNPVWLWKVDTDPRVMADQLPHGYASIDYIVMAGQARSTLDSLPTLKTGLAHSDLVVRFGEVEIRKVSPPPAP